MKAIGIVVEYNPFHNGHLYQINKIKETFSDYVIIVVMSGTFTQRGEAAIIDKYKRSTIALNLGVDIVVELPFVFGTQSADYFSKGAIELLNEMLVEYIVFGSESDDIANLYKIAEVQINNPCFDSLVSNYAKSGLSYPTCVSNAVYDITKLSVKEPNDLLGISYIKEIIANRYNIKPVCIKRTNEYHSDSIDVISSASAIRQAIRDDKDIKLAVPTITYKYLSDKNYFTDDYFGYLKYRINTCDDLTIYNSVDISLNNRIKKFINNSNSLEELVFLLKTKKYTYNRINRMLLHILVGFTKEENNLIKRNEYIRILGFTKKGSFYLRENKKQINLPIIFGFNKKYLSSIIELRSLYVYYSLLDFDKQKELIDLEFKNKPIIV